MITVRIRFKKIQEASYISLLDLQRVMQRVLKRSGLPVWYTLGFNPHIYMTFGCPLPLGEESLCECVDVKTEEETPDYGQWRDALNRAMPAGIEVYAVYRAEAKADAIAFANYRVSYSPAARPVLEKYNAQTSAPAEKKTKSGVREIELKQYMPRLDAELLGGRLSFKVQLPSSGSLNLNPMLLCSYLEAQYSLPVSDAAILRTEFLTAEGKAFL